eukprot:SAG31_NODE_15940_length_730_cov_1.587956_2_plen_174_part_00
MDRTSVCTTNLEQVMYVYACCYALDLTIDTRRAAANGAVPHVPRLCWTARACTADYWVTLRDRCELHPAPSLLVRAARRRSPQRPRRCCAPSNTEFCATKLLLLPASKLFNGSGPLEPCATFLYLTPTTFPAGRRDVPAYGQEGTIGGFSQGWFDGFGLTLCYFSFSKSDLYF